MAHGDHSITPTFSSSDERTNISLEERYERDWGEIPFPSEKLDTLRARIGEPIIPNTR